MSNILFNNMSSAPKINYYPTLKDYIAKPKKCKGSIHDNGLKLLKEILTEKDVLPDWLFSNYWDGDLAGIDVDGSSKPAKYKEPQLMKLAAIILCKPEIKRQLRARAFKKERRDNSRIDEQFCEHRACFRAAFKLDKKPEQDQIPENKVFQLSVVAGFLINEVAKTAFLNDVQFSDLIKFIEVNQFNLQFSPETLATHLDTHIVPELKSNWELLVSFANDAQDKGLLNDVELDPESSSSEDGDIDLINYDPSKMLRTALGKIAVLWEILEYIRDNPDYKDQREEVEPPVTVFETIRDMFEVVLAEHRHRCSRIRRRNRKPKRNATDSKIQEDDLGSNTEIPPNVPIPDEVVKEGSKIPAWISRLRSFIRNLWSLNRSKESK